MKTTKKFLAIFLALTMLFTVCSLSVFAINDPDYIITGEDHNRSDGITGEGRIWISANGRAIQYSVVGYYDSGDYTGPDPICTLYAQCAIVYTDGSSDVEYISQEFMLREGYGEEYPDTISANINKEIEMVCCEFQIFNANGILWEGMFDVSYTNE